MSIAFISTVLLAWVPWLSVISYLYVVFSAIFSFVIVYSFAPFTFISFSFSGFIFASPFSLFIVIVTFTGPWVHPFGSILVSIRIPVAFSPIFATYFSSIVNSYPL